MAIDYKAKYELENTIDKLQDIKAEAISTGKNIKVAGKDSIMCDSKTGMLLENSALYEVNGDIVGWLTISNSLIDYPVMQTQEQEDYYLYRDFYKNKNKNGCLIMDKDSKVTSEDENKNSDIFIIYGHNMKTGAMFGKLEEYATYEYQKKHSIINFETLYIKLEYEVMTAFYSEVFDKDENCFKYYETTDFKNENEFKDWYTNVKKLGIYDTGITAEYGDRFIVLSTCSYHKDNGRFVVIGRKRKK